MNVLMIVPKYSPSAVHYDFPLGLAYISAAIKAEGFPLIGLNLNHHLHVDHAGLIRRTIETHHIDVVCTGGLITHYGNIANILNTVKQIKPEVLTIVGGGMITCEPELVYENLKVDYGVLGEGDITIRELLRALAEHRDPGDVNGLIYRDADGRAVKTPPREPVMDLSALPMPDYRGLGLDYYLDNQMPYDSSNLHIFDEPRVMPVISSRSCPYQCSFCYHPLGNKYRSRDLDEFFREIDYLITQYDVNGFLILDELLCHKKERLQEFCRRMKPYHVRWMAQLRVDSVDEELLGMLKESGCYFISYGIESANDEILRSMKKHTTVAQIEKALELTYNMGISVQGNLLFSDRAETFETANESIRWAMDHWYYRLQLAPLFAFPTSSDYQYALEKGLIPDKLEHIKNGCRFVNISRQSQEEIDAILAATFSFSLHLLLLPREGEIKTVGYDFQRGAPVHDLVLTCPHCEKKVYYRNICLYQYVINNRFLHCKYCHGRFDIQIDWFEFFQNAQAPDGSRFLAQTNAQRQQYASHAERFRPLARMKAPQKAEHPWFAYTMSAAEPAEPQRKFAILLPLTNSYKKFAVDLGETLAGNGIDACVFEIPGNSAPAVSQCDRNLLHEFYKKEGITDTFTINATRAELFVPDTIRHHRLLQGSEPGGFSADGNDIMLTAKASWPQHLLPATRYHSFYREPSFDNDYMADIGVTCNYIHPLPKLPEQTLAVLQPFFEAIKKQLLDTQNFTATPARADELLWAAEKHHNHRLQGGRAAIAAFIASDFIPAVLRSETLRRLKYLAGKHNWRLRIAGRYWEQIPACRPYCIDFVGYGEPMARFLQSCKTVIHLPGENNVELLDILACGGFPILHAEPDEHIGNAFTEFFPASALAVCSSDADLENTLSCYLNEHPDQRLSMICNAACRIREHFTCEALVRELLEQSVGV